MRFRLLKGKHQSGKKLDGTLKNYAAKRESRDRDTGEIRLVFHRGVQYYFTKTGKKLPDGTDAYSCESRMEELPDIIETDVDLIRRFGNTTLEGRFNIGPKYQRLGAIPSVADEGEELEIQTIPQLQEFAEAEEIDISGLTKKADIIKAIREAGVPVG